MTDAKLVRLLEDLYRATTTFGADPSAVNRERYDAAFDAIVAHVREREVELMALAMWYELRGADEETGPETIEQAFARWRTFPPRLHEIWHEAARALRDAYDQQGEGA